MTNPIPIVPELPTNFLRKSCWYDRVRWIPRPLSKNPTLISINLGRWWIRAGLTGHLNLRPELAWGNPFYVGQDYCVGWMGFYIGAEFAG